MEVGGKKKTFYAICQFICLQFLETRVNQIANIL